MTWSGLLTAAGAIGAVPLTVLLLLAGTGSLALGPALLAIAACAAAAAFLAAVWLYDLGRLSAILHRVAEPGGSRLASPRLAPLAAIADQVEQLMRQQAARQAMADRRLAVDEAIVDRLPDPLVVLAADRSVGRVNAAARQVFGDDVRAVLRHPTLRAAIDRAQLRGGLQTADLSLPGPFSRDVQATVIVLDRREDGQIENGPIALVLSDRTRERAVERMREDFVANASHELRTPLTSLIGFIDTLRGPAADDPPAQQRFLGIMAEQAARMNRLIDDLLSLSRIELSEHRPPADRLDIEDLVQRIVAGFEPRVKARRITLRVDICPGLPAVTGDADQVEQVLQNLLDNAVKYGREGGLVGVTAGPAPPTGRWPRRAGVVIAVSDDGPGIPKVHLSRLTERFYRVDKARSRDAGGTGLGLAIVKHIVNRHRGQLLVESEEGKGSVFSVWLPLAP